MGNLWFYRELTSKNQRKWVRQVFVIGIYVAEDKGFEKIISLIIAIAW